MTSDINLTGLSPDQTVDDLCYAILERAGKPLHYQQVAELLVQVKPLETKTANCTLPQSMVLWNQCSVVAAIQKTPGGE
jgi:hypothetical protein